MGEERYRDDDCRIKSGDEGYGKPYRIFREEEMKIQTKYGDLNKWGVFEGKDDIHIIPCSRGGFTNHNISKTCSCNPEPTTEGLKVIWSHKEAS